MSGVPETERPEQEEMIKKPVKRLYEKGIGEDPVPFFVERRS